MRVPGLDGGLQFDRDALGHELRWRNDEIGRVAPALAAGESELVVSTELDYELMQR